MEQDELGTTVLICLSVERNTTLQLLGVSFIQNSATLNCTLVQEGSPT